MKVAFCGHSDVYNDKEVEIWLKKVVEEVILLGVNTFYLGGYGGFDYLAKRVVWELKENYPHIESVLVLPYLNRNIDDSKYDSTIYPPLETVPKRFAISKRNEWMIKEADIVISYVIHSWGGAAKTLEFAQRKKKKILNYPELLEKKENTN